MRSFLYLLFCFFAIGLADKVTRSHRRGHGSPVPKSYGSYALFSKVSSSSFDEYYGYATFAKREEPTATATTTIATRTHHRGFGSPLPKGRGSPVPINKDRNDEAHLLYEVLEILKEYEDGFTQTTSKTVELSTLSTLVKRDQVIATILPHSPDSLIHDATSSFEQITADTSTNSTATIEQVLSSAHPPFARRGWSLSQAVLKVMSNFFHSGPLVKAIRKSPASEKRELSGEEIEIVPRRAHVKSQ